MHSSILTILAIGSFYLTSSSAAPTSSSQPGIAATVNHLDSKNMLHWTPSGNGRATTIPGGLITYAHKQLASNNPTQKLRIRGAPEADVGDWTNIGQISDYAARYACEQDGEYGVATTIESYVTDACTGLLDQVPGVPTAESAWRVWKSAASPGADGDQVSTIFRFFTNTAAAPKLTRSICSTVIADLTSTFCQGTGDKSADTRGGEIQIGTGDDYLVIGLDPNKA